MPDQPDRQHAPPSPDRYRPLRTLLLSLAGLCALVAAMYAFVALSPLDPWGESIDVDQLSVYYTADVPADKAEALARFLHDKGVGRITPADARLRRGGGGWVVDLFLPQNDDTDTDATTTMLERMHLDLCRDVLGGGPLVIRACHPLLDGGKPNRRGTPKAWKEIGP